MIPKTCKDFEEHPEWKGCCMSCHDEMDSGLYWDVPLEIYPNEDYKLPVYASVCCYVREIAQKEADKQWKMTQKI